jgi:dihydrofolate synthase/folylpolyglutamate synthase
MRVAGTNGKGSTSFMLAAALESGGLKTGLYTSPHILAFNERIRIDGLPVSDERLLQSLEILMPAALKIGASYFETATALALDQFAHSAVDVEILEAGVGARLDATTAVPADIALVTPIGLDHQLWLGDTLKEITEEKACVMDGCRHTFSAPQHEDVRSVLLRHNPELQFVSPESWETLTAIGEHQQINASLAFAVTEMLIEEKQINGDLQRARTAIGNCHIPGRLEKIKIGHANIWLDAAHNRHAISALLPTLKKLADPFDAILIFTRTDRSLQNEVALFASYGKEVLCRTDALESGEVVSQLQRHIAAHPDGSFLVLGSFMTVAEILRNRSKLEPKFWRVVGKPG